jgi:hypothetical protein
MIELIDIDASTARPILSLNRGLVTQPLLGSSGGVSALASLASNPFLVAAGLTDGITFAHRTPTFAITCMRDDVFVLQIVPRDASRAFS